MEINMFWAWTLWITNTSMISGGSLDQQHSFVLGGKWAHGLRQQHRQQTPMWPLVATGFTEINMVLQSTDTNMIFSNSTNHRYRQGLRWQFRPQTFTWTTTWGVSMKEGHQQIWVNIGRGVGKACACSRLLHTTQPTLLGIHMVYCPSPLCLYFCLSPLFMNLSITPSFPPLHP